MGNETVAFEDLKISILISSIYFFLDFVFILSDGECLRLVVIHNKELLTFKKYKTVKGAKIGFYRQYRHKAWKGAIKPNWSVFYRPAAEWLRERWEVIGKYVD
ncbi:MAG: hypothetical protein GY950_22425 [bacterium]|nr:hypothetical protein [bacterium]